MKLDELLSEAFDMDAHKAKLKKHYEEEKEIIRDFFGGKDFETLGNGYSRGAEIGDRYDKKMVELGFKPRRGVSDPRTFPAIKDNPLRKLIDPEDKETLKRIPKAKRSPPEKPLRENPYGPDPEIREKWKLYKRGQGEFGKGQSFYMLKSGDKSVLLQTYPGRSISLYVAK